MLTDSPKWGIIQKEELPEIGMHSTECRAVDTLAAIRLAAPPRATKGDDAPKIQEGRSVVIDETTDENLLSLVCDGSSEALTILFRRYARVVRGIAYRVLRDPSEADDLLQDIFGHFSPPISHFPPLLQPA